MNAAARLVNRHVLPRSMVIPFTVSRVQWVMLTMMMFVLISLMSTIYITHVTRQLHIGLQHSLIDRDRLHVMEGQLLLERGTLMMQARIQRMAEQQLGMFIPNHKSVVIVHE